MSGFGPTRYARRGDAHIAYRVSEGEGPDVVVPMPGFMPMAALNDAFARRFADRIAALGRVVLMERQGVGESDPIDPTNVPTLDEVVEDVVAVMDRAELPQAALYGFYNAGPIGIRLAVGHPHRLSKLALVNSFVTWEPKPGVRGVAPYYRQLFAEEVEHGAGGELDLLSTIAPSRAADPEFRAWWDDMGRRGASPRSALAMGQAQADWDVTGDLAAVSAPTIVVHRRDNHFIPVSHARYAAERIPGATLVELPGVDFLGMLGDVDALFDPVEEFLTGRPPTRERSLAAVLFTDLVQSTARAVREGDRAWSALLSEHDQVAREAVVANGGQVIKSTGDGVLAVFTGAVAAIQAARSIQVHLASRDLTVRAGIHAGEIERLANDVTGIAVTIAARVMDLAKGGEVLVSGAVPPLVAGSGLEFESRGEVELKGVPGNWTIHSPR